MGGELLAALLACEDGLMWALCGSRHKPGGECNRLPGAMLSAAVVGLLMAPTLLSSPPLQFNGQALPPKEEVGPPLTAAERAELVRSLWGWVERPPGSEDEDEDEDEDEGDADEEEDSMVE